MRVSRQDCGYPERRIAAEAAHRRHHVGGVADQKDAPLGEVLGDLGDRAPRGDVADRHIDARHADRRAHEADGAVLVDAVGDVERIGPGHVAPRHDGEKAGIAGAHQAEEAAQLRIEHIDDAEIAPAQRRAALGMKIDRHAIGQVAGPAGADAELGADRAAVAVGGDHVFGAHHIGLAGQDVANAAGDAVRILLEGRQLGGVAHGGAELLGARADQRLEALLGHEQPGRRADRGHAVVEVGDIGRDLPPGQRFRPR